MSLSIPNNLRLNLAEKLENSVNPQLTVRRTSELQIKQWSKSKSYLETIIGIIECRDFTQSVKILTAIAMKNHIAKNWVVYSSHLKSICKHTIISLLLTNGNVQIAKQLLEMVQIISKHDFPRDWLIVSMGMVPMNANGIVILQIVHAMFKKFRHEIATHQLWEEIESSTVVASLLTDLLMRFMFDYKANQASDEQFQMLLLTVKIIRSLSFHDLPEDFCIQMPLIMDVFNTILCLPTNDDKKVGLIDELQSSACLTFAHFAYRYTKDVNEYVHRFMTRVLMLKSKIEHSSLTKFTVLKHNICQVESVIQKRNLFAAHVTMNSIQISAKTLEIGDKLKQLIMNLPEQKKILTKKSFSNFSLKSNLVKSLFEVGLDKVTKSQDQMLSRLLQIGRTETYLALTVIPGEGSSLALCIALLNKVEITRHTQALYVAETLESAMYIYKTLSRLARYTGIRVQLASQNLGGTCHILVCTPRDLIFLPSDLLHIMYVVYDDADKTIRSWKVLHGLLLRVSFGHQLIALSSSPNKAWLKTIPPFATKLMVSNIKMKNSQHYYVKCLNLTDKLHFLVKLCEALQSKSERALVFCGTSSLDLVMETLRKNGVYACATHADMDISQRVVQLEDFETKSYYTAMCCTNGLSRGIALPGVKIVINFDFPAQHTFYFFRSSRVQILGNEGHILSMVDENEEATINVFAGKLKLGELIEIK